MGRDTVEVWKVIEGRVRIVHMSGKMVPVPCVHLRTIFQWEEDFLWQIEVSLSLIWIKGDDDKIIELVWFFIDIFINSHN